MQLAYKGYQGKVRFDDEEGEFVGVMVGEPDPVTFRGATMEDLVQAFHETVDRLAAQRERHEQRRWPKL